MSDEEKRLLAYAKDLLKDTRFESVVFRMACRLSGDEGYHSVPHLFWGALRHGEEVEKERGDDDEEAFKASLDERLSVINEALDIIKDCVVILSTSVTYEKAIEAHRQLRQSGIDLDFVNSKADNSNRLKMIEEKLDVVLECMLVLTAEQVGEELETARAIVKQMKKKK